MYSVWPYKAYVILTAISSVLLSAGCATTSPSNNAVVDPYESINRPVYEFNNHVDSYVAKPMADAYKFVTPEFLQKGVSNFFNNLQDINVILNDVLQAKFKQGAKDLGRLSLNTTLGFLGVIDVASDAGLERHNEDFGQTLAVWGVPQGSYLVLPFVGPTTFREIPGYVVDTVTNPANYTGISIPLAGVSLLNTRANAEGSLKFINEAAIDPYVFTREAYLQWRKYEASDGKIDASQDMEDLEADLLEDDKRSVKPQPVIEADKNKAEFDKRSKATNNSIESNKTQNDQQFINAKHAFEKADAKMKKLEQKK